MPTMLEQIEEIDQIVEKTANGNVTSQQHFPTPSSTCRSQSASYIIAIMHMHRKPGYLKCRVA